MDTDSGTIAEAFMRRTLLVLCLVLPTMGFGQSLGELAKKRKRAPGEE
jgi:hypothetical protein